MPGPTLSELHQRMEEMIRWSEETNLAVARGGATDEVARMSRLSLWLTLVFAFDGFVRQASRALGVEKELRSAKKAEPGEPDAVLRLKLLERKLELDLSLPGESALAVIRRHMLLRNHWVHNLGLVSVVGPDLASIAASDGPEQQAWVTEAGWSELRCAVTTLSVRIVGLKPLAGDSRSRDR